MKTLRVLAIGACLAWATAPAFAAGDGTTLVVLGDSLGSGHGLDDASKGWVSLLRQRLAARSPDAIEVVNASRAGKTLEDGLGELPALLSEHHPGIVLIELGGNDAYLGATPAAMEASLGELVDLARAQHARVAILGIELPAVLDHDGALVALQQAYAGVAASRGVVVDTSLLRGIAGHPERVQADGVHPLAEAQADMLDNAWPAIAPLLAAPAATPGPALELQFIDSAQAVADWSADCVAGGEFAAIAARSAPDPGIDEQQRKALAAGLGETEFARIAHAAWEKANAALPQGPVHVCVDFAPPSDAFTRDRMGGVAGVTAGHGRILLKVSPDADWESALPYALAHEMHHSYWAQHYFDAGRAFTLADYMVFEGRADYFAGTLFPRSAPWTHALDAAAYASAWNTIATELDATDPQVLMAGMFGSTQAGIPAWAGYSIGYRLVGERMAREPKLDLAAMSAAPAMEFMPPAP
jgi:acyl-CoA thioesterase-1